MQTGTVAAASSAWEALAAAAEPDLAWLESPSAKAPSSDLPCEAEAPGYVQPRARFRRASLGRHDSPPVVCAGRDEPKQVCRSTRPSDDIPYRIPTPPHPDP